MACHAIPDGEPEGGGHHRVKETPRQDFADIPMWQPTEILAALVSSEALPAGEPEAYHISRDAIAELPGDLRISAKAGDGKVKIHHNDGEDPVPSGAGGSLPEDPPEGPAAESAEPELEKGPSRRKTLAIQSSRLRSG